MQITVTLNGRELTEDVSPDQTLFQWCRAHSMKSVKCGCETSNCGLCTVWVDGEPVLSCSVPMGRMDGHAITTLEGTGHERELFARCMAEEGAEQCGFCSPGLEMDVLALDRENPDATDDEIRRALSGNLCRCSGYAGQMRAIRRFLARHKDPDGNLPERSYAAEQQVRAAAAAVKDVNRGTDISKPAVKKDAQALLAGKPAYVDDLAPADCLIVRMVRSSQAHARVSAIDKTKALAIPGVVAVWGPDDVPHHRFTLAGQSYLECSPYDTVILDSTVRYVGDEVAIVVAETEAAAAAAVKAVKVTYEKLPVLLDMREALDNEVVIHDEDDWAYGADATGDPKRNLVCTGGHEHGDLDAAFAEADVVIEREYHTQAAEQAMMETMRCYAEVDAFGRLTIVSSTQVPFHIRRQVATALGIPKSQVRIVKPRVGGAFGAKQTGCNEVFAALAALRTGRPCKSIYTRQETMTCTNSRHEMRLRVKMGAKRDGTITAIDLYALSNAGAYGYHATTTIGLVGAKSLPVYNRAASRFSYDVVYTNTMPGGAYRGYGATQGCFAIESTVNEMADTLGMDPCEFRLKNVVKQGETLWQLDEDPLRSCRLDECLEHVMELTDWKGRPMVEELPDGRVRSRGVALTMQGSGISNVDIANVDITLEDDGFYVLKIGATDVGTGADTILAQIAAEVLGCDVDRVVTKGVDTDVSPFDCGAYASSGTYTTGGAVVRAATDLCEKVRTQAAKWWDVPVEQVEFVDDVVRTLDGSQSMTAGELANRAIGFGLNPGMLSGHGTNTQPQSPPPFIAAVATIDLDRETGHYDLVDYAAVVDCGTVINANLARVQVEGGLVQGIGMAMTEEVSYDDRGKMRTDSFMQYKLPSRMDVPDVRVEFMPSYEPTGPFGAKSIGEVVINTPSPAIASAVAHATGNYVRELPITPEKALHGDGGAVAAEEE
jgi:CO/xanthine dehydrogenase Mo-binding subunit/aerobic-type carbon monoxide dehydrogenase small subunit (CoxS/CutS family)